MWAEKVHNSGELDDTDLPVRKEEVHAWPELGTQSHLTELL